MKAKVLLIPGTSDHIRLLPYDSWHFPMWKAFCNLSRINAEGGSMWKAELPTSSDSDAFVDAEIEGDVLVAWSWSGFQVKIDLLTGRMLDKLFTK